MRGGSIEYRGESTKRGSPLTIIIYSNILEMQLIGKFHTPAARRYPPAASHAVKVLSQAEGGGKVESASERASVLWLHAELPPTHTHTIQGR